MNWVDILICVVLAVSTIVGVVRGATGEVLSLVVWIAGFWLAWRFGPQVAPLLAKWISSSAVRLYIGYAGVFLITVLVGSVVSAVIARLIRSSVLAGTDRTIGAMVGLLRGFVLVIAAIMLASINGAQATPSWRNSLIVPRLVPLANGVQSLIPGVWLKSFVSSKPVSLSSHHTDH